MTNDTQDAIRQFAKALEKHAIPCDELYLFGSSARGDAHEWSDIDIGVVGPSFGKDRIEESVALRSLAYTIDPAIAPIPLRPEDLNDRFNTISAAIKREGKKISL
jgi:predicted nucleotidyltransferase